MPLITTTEENEFNDGKIRSEDCFVNGTKVFYKIEKPYFILWYP